MIRYLWRTLGAHVRAGKTLYVLTLLGVALGVASVLSIQILNLNALGAFEGSVKAVSGEADLSILPRGPVLDETVYPRVLGVPGVEAAWPIYRADVALKGRRDFYLEIVGTDLLGPAALPWQGSRGEPGDVLGWRGWCAVTPELASEMGWRTGDVFRVSSGSRVVPLRVGALVDFRRVSPLASRRLVVTDIAQAQGLFGGRGEIHQIDVRLAGDVDTAEVRRALSLACGPAVRVETPEQRRRRASGLLGAFRLNLTALSLISLFVGGFLIFSSTRAALVRRRSEFGLLRSVGATPRQVLGLILAEVSLLGALGVAVGLPLGYALAEANMGTVSDTISNLYMLREIERLRLPPWLYGLAALVGAGGVLAGALIPAIESSRKETRALLATFTLHERTGSSARTLFLAGCAILAVAGLGCLWPGARWRPAGFVIAVGLLASVPLVVPLILRRTCAALRVGSFGLIYGIRTLGLRLGATAVAVAALAVAVSMLVGITLMIGSFRRTVEIWVNHTVHADVYITTESWQRARREATLDPSLERDISNLPGVRATDRLRQFFAETAGGRRISVAGAEMARPVSEHRFELVRGEPEEALRQVREEGAALVSEPLARKEGLEIGDRVEVFGPRGPASFPVAGVFYDYSSEGGGVFLNLSTFESRFGSGPVNNLALYLEPDVDAERMVDTVRARFPEAPLLVRSNRNLREEVFSIFDRTFAVTRLLQGMSLLIAAAGITLTLLILARERVSELALYRSLGANRPQVFRVFLGQGIGMAVLGLALGIAGGVGLAMVLIFIINRAWFGWTIALHWPWGHLAREVTIILAAAVAASLYPAWRASRTPATEISRDDL